MGEGITIEVPTLAALLASALGATLAIVWLRPRWILDWPRAVLSLLLLLTLLAGAQLVATDPWGLRLQLDPSTEPLLPTGDPAQRFYESAVRDFGDDETYVIGLECEEVFRVSCLETLNRISGPISRLAGVRSLSSLVDVTAFRFVPEEDWIEVRPFIDEIPRAPEALADLRVRALADPVYRRTLISDDARAAAVNVRFRKMTNAELIERDLDGQIRGILDQQADRRFYVSGRPHFKTHVYNGMVADLVRLIPIGIAVVAIVLWCFTGSYRGMVLPILTAVTAIVWTFSAMVVTHTPLNLLTVLLAPMLLALGSVYVVHFLTRFEEEAREVESLAPAVRRCLEHMRLPVLIAGLTTMVGFAALLISDVPAVYELGLLSMLGIASATVLVLTGVPAALLVMPLPAVSLSQRHTLRARVGRVVEAVLDRALTSLAGLVRRRASAILLLCGLAAVVAAASLPRIVVDTDYLSYFDESDPVRMDFDAVNRLLAGAVPLYVVLEGGGPGAFRDPAVLRGMEDLQRKINALPGVSRTLSFVDSLRALNRAFAGDDPREERVPDTRGAVTELLFMLPKAETFPYLTVNHGRANIVVRTGEVGSAAISQLKREIDEVIATTPLPAGIEAQVTGNALLLARSADGIARGQPRSVALAAVAIFVLIAFGLRSPKLGAVAMIPNLLPVLIFFGILGLGAAPLSLPTSLIGCIALGIAIDDTVHFLVRYRGEREKGADPEQAALRCGRRIGRPIAITSIMLVMGFLVVAFSRFATLQEFGVLTGVTMAVCLVTDLVMLPALLIRLRL